MLRVCCELAVVGGDCAMRVNDFLELIAGLHEESVCHPVDASCVFSALEAELLPIVMRL